MTTNEYSLEVSEQFGIAVKAAIVRNPKRILEALAEAGYLVEVTAARNAQEKFNHPTGNLPTNIHSEVHKAEFETAIGSNVEYGRLRELGGTVAHAWGHVTAHHTGRPYLSPALQAETPKIIEAFKRAIDEILHGIENDTKGT